MAKINKKKFETACQNTGGILTQIAKNLKVTRKSVYEFMAKNPEFCNPLVKQEREKITDMAEGQLFRNIKENQAWSIKYYLATMGKDRGYVEKQIVEHEGDVPVNISIGVDTEGFVKKKK